MKFWHVGGNRGKVMVSPKILEAILWGPSTARLVPRALIIYGEPMTFPLLPPAQQSKCWLRGDFYLLIGVGYLSFCNL